MFKEKKVIIFDMDGTLIDSVGMWNKTDEILINKLNNSVTQVENIQQMRDSTLAQCTTSNIYLEYCEFLGKKYNSNLSAEEILKLRKQISSNYTKNEIDYKPDAEKVLHFLKSKGYILVLATTTTKINIKTYREENENIIKKANLDDIFSIILTQEDVTEKKPNPEVHNKILEKLDVTQEECIVIEDSLIGVQAAKNAGIEVAVMYDKYSDGDREEINKLSQNQFKDFNEMLEYIQRELD